MDTETGKNDTSLRRYSCAAAAIACAVVLAGVLTLFFGSTEGGGTRQLLRMYLCVALGFLGMLAVYHIGYGAAKKINAKRAPAPSWLLRLLTAGAAAASLFFVLRWQVVGGDLPGIISTSGVILVLAGWFLFSPLFVVLLHMDNGSLRRIEKAARVLMLGLAALYTWMVDLLNFGHDIVRHYTAMTQPLYNVAFDQPFVVNSSSTYGHFAIFFWPVLKVLGHSPYVIAVIMTGCNVAVELLILWLAARLIKNTAIRLLLTLASGSLWVSTYLYTAVSPLRTLWPLILLAYVIHGWQRETPCRHPYLRCWGGYLLCGLAIVWNTDSGLTATVAYTVCLWMACWHTQRVFSAQALRLYLLTAAGCVVSALETVAVINVYNLLCGGPLILRACFFPLLGSGFAESLGISMDRVGHGWVLPVCVFVLSIAVGLLSTALMRAWKNREALCLAFCGMAGLGQCYYFFNRGMAGWGNVYPIQLLCLAMLAELGYVWAANKPAAHPYQALRAGAGIASLLWLGVFAVSMLSGAPSLVSNKIDGEVYSMDRLDSVAEKIRQAVPPNTYAFGFFTQEIYARLGWDPGYHWRDVEDIYTNARDLAEPGEDSFTQTSREILAEVNMQDGILVSDRQTNALIDNRELLPENAFAPDGDRVHWFYYYTKNPPVPSVCDFESYGKQKLPVLQARCYGFGHDDDEYEYWLTAHNTMVLNAETLHESGLQFELHLPDGGLAGSGLTGAEITALVEDVPLAGVRLLPEDDETNRTCTLVIGPEDLPDVPADGMYDIELALECEGGAGGRVCDILYAGPPR